MHISALCLSSTVLNICSLTNKEKNVFLKRQATEVFLALQISVRVGTLRRDHSVINYSLIQLLALVFFCLRAASRLTGCYRIRADIIGPTLLRLFRSYTENTEVEHLHISWS